MLSQGRSEMKSPMDCQGIQTFRSRRIWERKETTSSKYFPKDEKEKGRGK